MTLSSLTFTISNTTTTIQNTPQFNNNNVVPVPVPSLNTFCSITLNKTHLFRIHCINQDPLSPLEPLKSDQNPPFGNEGGDGGGNDGEGGGEEEEGDEEFGPLLNFEAVYDRSWC
jgi:hypothetical protein